MNKFNLLPIIILTVMIMGLIGVPINNAPASMPNICIQNLSGCGGYLDNSFINMSFINASIDIRNFYNETRINQTINDNLNIIYGNLTLKANKTGDTFTGNVNITNNLSVINTLTIEILCIRNCSIYKTYYNGSNIITEVYL